MEFWYDTLFCEDSSPWPIHITSDSALTCNLCSATIVISYFSLYYMNSPINQCIVYIGNKFLGIITCFLKVYMLIDEYSDHRFLYFSFLQAHLLLSSLLCCFSIFFTEIYPTFHTPQSSSQNQENIYDPYILISWLQKAENMKRSRKITSSVFLAAMKAIYSWNDLFIPFQHI